MVVVAQHMFCDASPIWPFLSALRAREDPAEARSAGAGTYLIEVFPALALPALHQPFAKRLGAPKYNPQNRRKFRIDDWKAVCEVVALVAESLGIHDLWLWATDMSLLPGPRKRDQDQIDAAICALVGLLWRAGERSSSLMIGDLQTGYMITPATEATQLRLKTAADILHVPISQ